MALLEIILTHEIPKNPYELLCKLYKRGQIQQVLSHLNDPDLKDFVEKTMHEVPEKRLKCTELLQHQFLKIKPEDKDKEVTSLHTLGTLVRDVIRDFE